MSWSSSAVVMLNLVTLGHRHDFSSHTGRNFNVVNGMYKVIFVNNVVLACNKINVGITIDKDYHYEQQNGHPIHAIIKATSEEEALEKANLIVREITEKYNAGNAA
jgi:hypothetical protein